MGLAWLLSALLASSALLGATARQFGENEREQATSGGGNLLGVTVRNDGEYVTLSNDVITVVFSLPVGNIVSISYNGMRNVLNEVGTAADSEPLQFMKKRRLLNQGSRSSPHLTEPHSVEEAVSSNPSAKQSAFSPRLSEAQELFLRAIGVTPGSSLDDLSPEVMAELILQDPNMPLGFTRDASDLEEAAGYRAPGPLGNPENDRGYWDFTLPGAEGNQIRVACNEFKIISQGAGSAEISFVQNYQKAKASGLKAVPFDADFRYMLRAGDAALYKYVILKHAPSYPAVTVSEFRLVYKLKWDSFTYGATSGERKRFMPSNADREESRSYQLLFKEARNLTRPVNSAFKFECEDKYHYSSKISDDLVHGFASPSVGFWLLFPAKTEYFGGGPDKQTLTIQAAPNCIGHVHCGHYGTPGIALAENENWSKVYGPFVTYLNKPKAAGKSFQDAAAELWADAKSRAQREQQAWPYSFPSAEYIKADKRATVSGSFVVKDALLNSVDAVDFRKGGWVGLAKNGDRSRWDRDVKGYQFWTQLKFVGASGRFTFTIEDVHPGTYYLHGWVIGIFGMFMSDGPITVPASKNLILDEVSFSPPRAGPTLWKIGIPDRTAAEFYVPDLNPYSTYPFPPSDKANAFRDYGSWIRVLDFYKSTNSVYTIGKSKPETDWYYAHTTWCPRQGVPCTTTKRTIVFDIPSAPSSTATYTLRIAYAGANYGQLSIFANDKQIFDTGAKIGTTKDNAFARAGIQGIYMDYSVSISGSDLKAGTNTIGLVQRFLGQKPTESQFYYIMYDYIRLEGPAR